MNAEEENDLWEEEDETGSVAHRDLADLERERKAQRLLQTRRFIRSALLAFLLLAPPLLTSASLLALSPVIALLLVLLGLEVGGGFKAKREADKLEERIEAHRAQLRPSGETKDLLP